MRDSAAEGDPVAATEFDAVVGLKRERRGGGGSVTWRSLEEGVVEERGELDGCVGPGAGKADAKKEREKKGGGRHREHPPERNGVRCGRRWNLCIPSRSSWRTQHDGARVLPLFCLRGGCLKRRSIDFDEQRPTIITLPPSLPPRICSTRRMNAAGCWGGVRA